MKSQNLIGGVNLLPHVVVVAALRGEVGADVLGGRRGRYHGLPVGDVGDAGLLATATVALALMAWPITEWAAIGILDMHQTIYLLSPARGERQA